jgi:hypothetical protein
MTKEKPVESNENQKNLSENNESTIENNPTASNVVSDKNYVVALIISYLVGYFGVDRFYVGKIGTGILKLLTFGGLGIWWLIDFLLIGIGKFKDKKGLKLSGYDTAGHIGKPVALVLVIVNIVIVPFVFLIVLAGAGNIQRAARDSERQTDISNIIAELNTVYSTYGAYPSLDEMNDASWRAQVAPGITDSMLADPEALDQSNPQLVAMPQEKVYAYSAVAFEGGECVSGTGCASYTITYFSEKDDAFVTYNSLEDN